MANVLDFFIKLKTMNKPGTGAPTRQIPDALLAEYLGPVMHAKLHQAYRARRKKGGSLEL